MYSSVGSSAGTPKRVAEFVSSDESVESSYVSSSWSPLDSGLKFLLDCAPEKFQGKHYGLLQKFNLIILPAINTAKRNVRLQNEFMVNNW